uniref:Uncharacterized protein n=1 Tax=Oryza glumipatula TaxID=40148 RepID=A0A0D9YQM2_9ORYZ
MEHGERRTIVPLVIALKLIAPVATRVTNVVAVLELAAFVGVIANKAVPILDLPSSVGIAANELTSLLALNRVAIELSSRCIISPVAPPLLPSNIEIAHVLALHGAHNCVFQ